MPRSNKQMIKNLQRAINQQFNERILIDRNQWYSEQQERAITTYKVKKEISQESDKKTGRKYEELFVTFSEIQVVLFLRDYWFELNGMPVPDDNPVWTEAKQKYYDTR